MNTFYIITFNNAHEAMQAEEICLKEKVAVVMMPTPTYITKSCGISLKLNKEAMEEMKQLILKDKFKILKDKFKYKSIVYFENGKVSEINITN